MSNIPLVLSRPSIIFNIYNFHQSWYFTSDNFVQMHKRTKIFEILLHSLIPANIFSIVLTFNSLINMALQSY